MLKIRLTNESLSSCVTHPRLWVLEAFKIEFGFCAWLQI